MLNLLLALAYGFGLWLVRQFLDPWGGGYADLVMIVLPLWWWLSGRRLPAAVSILVASLLVDTVANPWWPLVFLTSLAAGWSYAEFIEPHLSFSTSLGQLLTVGVWLLWWRVWRVWWLALAWLGGRGSFDPPSHISVLSLAAWFAWGFIIWWSLQLGRKLLASGSRRQPKIQ
ncbi:MAG: hypothetical protein HY974_01495 [Candidatus Kerfeldbacteria bacterium]|nr:hypothetical protein [Candidatus Kerfeldbacteria bacterium]